MAVFLLISWLFIEAEISFLKYDLDVLYFEGNERIMPLNLLIIYDSFQRKMRERDYFSKKTILNINISHFLEHRHHPWPHKGFNSVQI